MKDPSEWTDDDLPQIRKKLIWRQRDTSHLNPPTIHIDQAFELTDDLHEPITVAETANYVGRRVESAVPCSSTVTPVFSITRIKRDENLIDEKRRFSDTPRAAPRNKGVIDERVTATSIGLFSIISRLVNYPR